MKPTIKTREDENNNKLLCSISFFKMAISVY